jgi:hypothetical protein
MSRVFLYEEMCFIIMVQPICKWWPWCQNQGVVLCISTMAEYSPLPWSTASRALKDLRHDFQMLAYNLFFMDSLSINKILGTLCSFDVDTTLVAVAEELPCDCTLTTRLQSWMNTYPSGLYTANISLEIEGNRIELIQEETSNPSL